MQGERGEGKGWGREREGGEAGEGGEGGEAKDFQMRDVREVVALLHHLISSSVLLSLSRLSFHSLASSSSFFSFPPL